MPNPYLRKSTKLSRFSIILPVKYPIELHEQVTGRFSSYDEEFKTIKQYIERTGTPVILGEWGITAAAPIEDRIDRAMYIIKKAHELGIPGFWRECGWSEQFDANENFPLFDRHKMQWAYPDLLKAIMECVQ